MSKVQNSFEVVEKLVNENMRLATMIAGQYIHLIDFNQSFSLAMEGLLEAAQDYKVESQCKFGSFAAFRMKNAICKYLTFIFRHKRKQEMNHVPIDKLIGDDSEKTIGDFIEDIFASNAAEFLMAKENAEMTKALLKTVKMKYRYIIKLRFGLDGEEEHTLKEVAEKLGSKYQIIQIMEKRALKKMWSNAQKLFKIEGDKNFALKRKKRIRNKTIKLNVDQKRFDWRIKYHQKREALAA